MADERKAIKGKVAIITGTSSGVGEAIAVELAAEGAKVVITARRQDRLVALQKRIESTHPGQIAYHNI